MALRCRTLSYADVVSTPEGSRGAPPTQHPPPPPLPAAAKPQRRSIATSPSSSPAQPPPRRLPRRASKVKVLGEQSLASLKPFSTFHSAVGICTRVGARLGPFPKHASVQVRMFSQASQAHLFSTDLGTDRTHSAGVPLHGRYFQSWPILDRSQHSSCSATKVVTRLPLE